MTVTNRQLINNAEQIFAHSADYQLPGMFANRKDSRTQLSQWLKDNKGEKQSIIISDLLGSGKTFLMEMVQAENNLKDSKPLICGKNKPKLMSQAAKNKAVFVDEWDIKANPKKFLKSLEWVKEYFDQTSTPLVLLGDYTLRGDFFHNQLKEYSDVINFVKMEQLFPVFFKTALKQRIERALNIKDDVSIIDTDLFNTLVPDWKTTPATFREVLRILMQLSYKLPVNDHPCSIGKREVRLWLSEQTYTGMTEMRMAFYNRLIPYLAEFFHSEKSLDPMTIADLRKAGTMENKMSDKEFYNDILQPLARGGLLSSVGVPTFTDDEYLRYPEPYLPSVVTMLRTHFQEEK